MESPTNYQAPEEHLFAETEAFQFTDASTAQRFFNFLIDNIVIQVGLSFIGGYIIGFVLAQFFPDTYYNWVNGNGSAQYIIAYLISYLDYLIYYTFCEKVFKGYTVGKLVTGTRAIRNDGGELTFRDAVLRSLSRIVPFEAFSGFGGHPWHDRWTDTQVIKTR